MKGQSAILFHLAAQCWTDASNPELPRAQPLAVKSPSAFLVLESLRVKTGSKPITHRLNQKKKAKAKATRLPNNPSLSPAFVSNSHLLQSRHAASGSTPIFVSLGLIPAGCLCLFPLSPCRAAWRTPNYRQQTRTPRPYQSLYHTDALTLFALKPET